MTTDSTTVVEYWSLSASDWIQIAIALLTFVAIIIALFGDWLRTKWFQPRFAIRLTKEKGEPVDVRVGQAQPVVPARYYHITVANLRKYPRADDVAVYLTSIREKNVQGEYIPKWSGEVPLRWRHQEIYPLFRAIGPEIDCDLASIVKDNGLVLHPILYPNNLTTVWSGAVNLIVTIVIRHRDGASPEHQVNITWDGDWATGENELAQHFNVKILP
jgi:hypothetical protein